MTPRSLRATGAALLLLTMLPGQASAASPPTADPGATPRSGLEETEDLTESLANHLHEVSFAILDRDMEKFAEHFAPDATGTDVPIGEGEPTAETRWVHTRPLREPVSLSGRGALATAWGEYLDTFRSLEDVRLKVKSAEMNTDGNGTVSASAYIKYFWIGRGPEGAREWVKGVGRVKASRPRDGPWTLHELTLTDLHPRVATANLFDEVSGPAGTALTVPRWGSPGNEEFMAHGVAVADLDDDGFLEIFVTGGGENHLYRSRGDGTYEDIAMNALVGVTPSATGPLFLDFDNDGDEDLFLASVGRQMFFENRFVPEGRVEFLERSEDAGVALPAHGYSAVSADVNSDGFPDIYVCSYNAYGTVMPNSWSQATNGTPNLLLINDGGRRFVEAAADWGVADSRWTYAAQFADLNGDHRADLYVANDFGVNAFYINEGDRFRDASREFGIDDTGNGMGVSFGDYDNDGRVDLHVTNMSSTAGNRILGVLFPDMEDSPEYARTLKKLASGNTLYRNTGDGSFRDVTSEVGPFSAGWAFGGGFLDFDNDGWQDIHTPNGFISGKGLRDT